MPKSKELSLKEKVGNLEEAVMEFSDILLDHQKEYQTLVTMLRLAIQAVGEEPKKKTFFQWFFGLEAK